MTYLTEGFDALLNRSTIVADDSDSSGGAYNSVSDTLSPSQLDSGSITSSLTVDRDGHLKGGQTDYNTGTGFFLGWSSTTYKFSIGDSSANYLTWDGTTLSISGSFSATTGTIGGFDIGSDYVRDVANSFGLASTVTGGDDVRIWAGSTFANRATAPFYVTEAGALVATSATITGTITASAGTIGGFSVGADYIRDAADSMGMASTVTGGNDVRFWAGDTFANRATADFFVTEDGAITATSATITGTISGRSTATIASAINASGNLVTDLINARLDTSAKTMLSNFTFGTADYSGALNSGTITWNTTTGALTGGSGVLVYRGGIIGAAAGVATFTLDAATGAATFAGALSAPSGNIGGWTINASSLADTAGVVGMSSLVTGGDDIRFWAGNVTPASAPFYVTEAGALTATSATITGVVTANTGFIGGATGWVIAANTIKDVAGVVGLSNVVTGGDDIRFWAGHATPASAPFYVTESGALVATSATISGTITASAGTIGGFNVGADYIRDAANSMGMASTVTAGDDVRFWAGDTFANRATADFYVTEAGALTASTATITGSISGRSTATVAAAINAAGNFINDLINVRIDTSAKTMLSNFTFGTADYAGALNSGTITWDTTTGALTGGSGVLVYRGGIIGAASGVATFTIDSATGTATFAGVLSAPSGNIGGWTINATSLTATTGAVGMSSLVTGGDDIRFWAGNATPASAPFYVTEAGVLVASSATITGTITATAGAIGGFDIGSDYIRDAANSMGLASTVSGSDDVRFWAGDTFANRATADFRVTEAGAVTATSAVINGSTLGFEDVFGDGSDGSATISGNTSLTKDMFYTDLTITSGATLDTAGFRVHCTGTLTVTNGLIGRPGNAGGAGGDTTTNTAGAAGTAGAALASGSMSGAVAGVAGATGGAGSTRSTNGLNSNDNDVAGTAGNAVVKAVTDTNGAAGGASSDSISMSTAGGTITSGVGSAGGAAGTKSGTVFNKVNTAFSAWLLQDFFPTQDALRSSAGSGSGASGSGGGCERSGTGTCTVTGTGGGGGGGSGSPGGLVGIYAKVIVVAASGTISAKGGDGGRGGNSGDGVISGTTTGDYNAQAGGAGGGGGGGSGGCLILVYSSLSNSGVISSAGGTGGAGGTHGRNNANGVYTDPTGASGTAGTNGNSGLTVQLTI